jgi:hypothetical protein
MWIQFVLPVATALLGWLGSAYRNKQKKENDTIANFQLMRDADKEFMMDLKNELVESKNMRKRLEAKLDRKNRSIRKANNCPHTNEDDGCPVLNQEEANERVYDEGCRLCEHHSEIKEKND